MSSFKPPLLKLIDAPYLDGNTFGPPKKHRKKLTLNPAGAIQSLAHHKVSKLLFLTSLWMTSSSALLLMER